MHQAAIATARAWLSSFDCEERRNIALALGSGLFGSLPSTKLCQKPAQQVDMQFRHPGSRVENCKAAPGRAHLWQAWCRQSALYTRQWLQDVATRAPVELVQDLVSLFDPRWTCACRSDLLRQD